MRFGDEIDADMDIRKSIQKNNAKMINIYLKTPYKVLSINEIKNKEKVDREKDLENNISPTRLYRAENNLNIATNYRRKNEYRPVREEGKFKHRRGEPTSAAMVNTSLFSDIEPEQTSTMKEKVTLTSRKAQNGNFNMTR